MFNKAYLICFLLGGGFDVIKEIFWICFNHSFNWIISYPFFAIMDGFDNYPFYADLRIFLIGASPFILLIGLPVSVLSDNLTKNKNGKQRKKEALFIHIIFGLIFGLFLSFFFEHLLHILFTLVAALIFWIVDEILRLKFKDNK